MRHELDKVYETTELEVWLEATQIGLFVHMHVHIWNASTAILIDELLEEFYKASGVSKIYAAVWNDKLERFARIFGFKDTGVMVNMKRISDDKLMESLVFIREKS